MRLTYIDIAKGITILLMVLGHSSIPQPLSNWIWSFHMPLFFFVSGMTTHWGRDAASFVIQKTGRLLWPFVGYSILNLLLLPLWKDGAWSDNVAQTLETGWGGCALWFIPVLYLALLLARAVPDKVASSALGAAVLAAIGSLLCRFHLSLPWTLSTVPIAAAYVLLGRLAASRAKRFLGEAFSSWRVAAFMLLCLMVQIPLSQLYHLDLAWNKVNPIVPLLAASIAGCFFMLCLSRLLCLQRQLAGLFPVVGRHTLEIMALSQCVIAVINRQLPSLGAAKYGLLAVILFVFVQVKDACKKRFPHIPL